MYHQKAVFTAFLITISSLFACKNDTSLKEYGMFRNNVQHKGVYPASDIKKIHGIKWRFKTNGYVNSSAAIEGDQLFFGSGDGYLYSLNIHDGSLLWKFKTGGAVYSSPAVVNGEVFFGSHDGNFYALNANDGKLKWIFKTEGEKLFSAKGLHRRLPKDSVFVDDWDFWLSSPAIQGNTIYFGSGDGNLYALNKNNGQIKWKFKTADIIHTSPALAFGNVYFGGWDTYLHALDAESGKEVWNFKTGEDTAFYNQTGITSSPVIVDSMLFFGCRDSYLYSLDALTGKLIWKKFNDEGWISCTPVVYHDKLIYGTGSSHYYFALNKLTGDSVYKVKGDTYFSSPSISGNLVVIGTVDGFVKAHNADSGNLLWAYQLPSSIEDVFRIHNPDGSFNADSIGTVYEKYQSSKSYLEIRLSVGSILSSPVIANGVIYFGSTDNYFYALY